MISFRILRKIEKKNYFQNKFKSNENYCNLTLFNKIPTNQFQIVFALYFAIKFIYLF
jgi:hypothetical protein